MRLVLAVAVFLGLASAALAVDGVEGPRLDGKYTAVYKRVDADVNGPVDWRIEARCPDLACNARVISAGGLRGVLRYRKTSGEYVLRARENSDLGCTNDKTGEVEGTFVLTRVIRFRHFGDAGPDGAVRFARGTVTDTYRPGQRARTLGCGVEEQNGEIRLKPR